MIFPLAPERIMRMPVKTVVHALSSWNPGSANEFYSVDRRFTFLRCGIFSFSEYRNSETHVSRRRSFIYKFRHKRSFGCAWKILSASGGK